MIKIINTIFSSIKRRGLLNTIKMIIAEFRFDKSNKIDTSGVIRTQDMTTKVGPTQECMEYMPSNVVVLDHIFDYLNKKYDLNNSSLVDYGCGKGRAIIYAHKFGFKNIIGVEFASDLCDVANHNMQNLMLKNIEVVNEDATTFVIPNSINIFYFFNPFNGSIMQKVIDNIDLYKEQSNKEILIVYVNPLCKNMFIESHYSIVYEYKDEVAVFEK